MVISIGRLFARDNHLSSNVNSGFNFFFSICCFVKSAVTRANAPPIILAIPNIAVPSNIPTIVMPKVPVASPPVFPYLRLLNVIYKLVTT